MTYFSTYLRTLMYKIRSQRSCSSTVLLMSCSDSWWTRFPSNSCPRSVPDTIDRNILHLQVFPDEIDSMCQHVLSSFSGSIDVDRFRRWDALEDANERRILFLDMYLSVSRALQWLHSRTLDEYHEETSVISKVFIWWCNTLWDSIYWSWLHDHPGGHTSWKETTMMKFIKESSSRIFVQKEYSKDAIKIKWISS